jgi:chemotaxis protein histidine kinase CheA
VSQGLLILDSGGVIGAQRSAIVSTWFGQRLTGMTFWDMIASLDPPASSMCRLAWDQLKSDVFPVEVTLDLLPKKIVVAQNVFEVTYRPIMNRGSLDHVLVVISDATPRLERERLESEQRELMAIFEHIVKDRSGVLAFFGEAKELVERATSEEVTDAVRRRYIHTLKGNCAMFGVSHLAGLCHRIEDSMAEDAGGLSERDRRFLAEGWRNVSKKLEVLVGNEGRRAIEIEETEYAAVMRALHVGAPREEIASAMTQWSLEPVKLYFSRFSNRARAVGARLGKADVIVTGDDGNVRLEASRWAPFWSAFVHVVYNAIDHGVESGDERLRVGKTKAGEIEMRARETSTGLVIELADDGRGIDWERVKARARAGGLPAENHADLVEALFADGVSTKETATDISGRGAGLGAVRQECRRLGGSVDVVSCRGKGTRFVFRFPLQKVLQPIADAA